MSLDGKRVVVIGGTSGIGFAVAELAAEEGASVVVASSNAEKVAAAVKRLPDGADGAQLDVTDEAAVEAFFAKVGEFDHLVFTAGEGLLLKPLAELATAEARGFFEIRYWGTFLSAKYGAPHIRQGGSMVFSSGSVITRPMPGAVAPAGTTGAGEALVRALAVELAPIRVNGVRPGPADTELWAATLPEPRSFIDAVGPELLTKRVGTAREVASTYVFLMNNGFSTGGIITVDGGHALV